MRASSTFRACSVALALCAGVDAPAQSGSVRAGDIVLHYWSGQERLAQSLLPGPDYLALPGLPPDIFARGDAVLVYIAPDAARWDSLTGGRAPEWGAGIALPARGIIVLPGYVSGRSGTHELPVTLRHELAHVALQRHLGDALVPRWFTEGYATWAAHQIDEGGAWMLRVALLTDRAPPLDSLTLEWPLLEVDARLAYLLSGTALRYLYSLGDDDTFRRFLDLWAASGSLEEAMREVYVISTAQFERLWRAHVKRRYGWLRVAAQTSFIWLVLTTIVLVLFVVRRRRDRSKLARLVDNEIPDEPAFWLVEQPPPSDEPDGEDSPPGTQ